MVRAEACRLLARVVDKLGVNGTLHLPTDSRDAVITAATSMVLDNTPTSRLSIYKHTVVSFYKYIQGLLDGQS